MGKVELGLHLAHHPTHAGSQLQGTALGITASRGAVPQSQNYNNTRKVSRTIETLFSTWNDIPYLCIITNPQQLHH